MVRKPTQREVDDPKLLHRYLDEIVLEVQGQAEALAETRTKAERVPTVRQIRDALSANGEAPLSIDGLVGQPIIPQGASVKTGSTVPAASDYLPGTVFVQTGTVPPKLYLREDTYPPTWVQLTGSGAATTTLIGPVTGASSTGTISTTITDDSVTFAKMQNIATDRLIGRDTAGTGDPEEISVSGGLEFSGTQSVRVADNGITDAKLRDSAALSVIGRSANSIGDPADIAAGEGQILRRINNVLGFGSEILVDTFGSVAIGGAGAPTALLDVFKSGTVEVRVRSTNSTGDANLIIESGDGTTSARKAVIQFISNETSTQGWIVGLRNGSKNFVIRDGTTTTDVITIDTSGNVGIGAAPTTGFRLDVIGGDFRVSDVASDDGVELGWSAGSSAGFVQAYDRNASAFRDLILNNSAIIIKSTGDIGIGVTPTYHFHVEKSVDSANVARIRNTSTTNGLGLDILVAASSNVNALRVLVNTAGGGGGNTALRVQANRNVVVGDAALSTSATDGFLYIPTCAGTPTGTPTAYTGTVAMVFDTTNNKLYIYDGGWISATFA